MRRHIAPILCALWLCPSASAQKAVLLVRHAEKVDNSKDAALSEAGLARARALAECLRSAGVTAIYTSEFQRTIKTAEPLAQKLGLEPQVVAAGDWKELTERVRALGEESVALIVGHSNSVPDLIAALGGPKDVEIPDPEYDNLFVLFPQGDGRARLLRLRY
jgi:broad specificity phosphatase PhoE